MKQTLELIAAPPSMSPGGYVAKAYEDKVDPSTPEVTVEALKVKNGWYVALAWPCPEPVNVIAHETDLFMDSAAILVPLHEEAELFTMGSSEAAVEGALWRAESDGFHHIRGEGLGSVIRGEAAKGWTVSSNWKDGIWSLECAFLNWPALDQFGQIALAVWRGSDRDRGGLKSITSDWIKIE